MMTWFASRTRREQALLCVLLAVTLAFAGYQFIYRPASDTYYAAKNDAQMAMRDLEIVTKSAPLLSQTSPQSKLSTFDRETLIKAAAEYGLTITGVQPQNSGQLEVWFDDEDGQEMLRFIYALETRYLAQIHRLNIDRRKGRRVAARLTLGPR